MSDTKYEPCVACSLLALARPCDILYCPPLLVRGLRYDINDDYIEMIIQYGYVTLFVVAFPLVPLLAFVSDYVEIRLDAFKVWPAQNMSSSSCDASVLHGS